MPAPEVGEQKPRRLASLAVFRCGLLLVSDWVPRGRWQMVFAAGTEGSVRTEGSREAQRGRDGRGRGRARGATPQSGSPAPCRPHSSLHHSAGARLCSPLLLPRQGAHGHSSSCSTLSSYSPRPARHPRRGVPTPPKFPVPPLPLTAIASRSLLPPLCFAFPPPAANVRGAHSSVRTVPQQTYSHSSRQQTRMRTALLSRCARRWYQSQGRSGACTLHTLRVDMQEAMLCGQPASAPRRCEAERGGCSVPRRNHRRSCCNVRPLLLLRLRLLLLVLLLVLVRVAAALPAACPARLPKSRSSEKRL